MKAALRDVFGLGGTESSIELIDCTRLREPMESEPLHVGLNAKLRVNFLWQRHAREQMSRDLRHVFPPARQRAPYA